MKITPYINLPSPEDFIRLRSYTSWGCVDVAQAEQALKNSLMGIYLRGDDETIAMARIVGDGVFNVYIQDVIVKPSHRRKGLGRNMLSTLITHMKSCLPADCTIGLMAAKEQDGFYTKLGFTSRPSSQFGAGMTAQLKELLP